jgi:hypothetical protein
MAFCVVEGIPDVVGDAFYSSWVLRTYEEILGRIALILSNPSLITSFFRTFAADLIRL